MKFSDIKIKAINAAREDVDAFAQENTIDELIEANSPRQLGWDDSAITAGVFEILCGRIEGVAAHNAFYETYAKEAKRYAAEIIAQYEE
jgi:hypothetical protein